MSVNISWVIYWTKEPNGKVHNPPLKDNGTKRDTLNAIYKELEYYTTEPVYKGWEGFVGESINQ